MKIKNFAALSAFEVKINFEATLKGVSALIFAPEGQIHFYGQITGEISYTFRENPIVLSENPQKSFCYRQNLVRYLQE